MKAKTTLTLDSDFDEKINLGIDKIIELKDDGAINSEAGQRQQFINYVRAKIHKAFEIGIKEGAKK